MITIHIPRERLWDYFKENSDALQYEDALVASGETSEIGITLSNFWKRPAFYVMGGKLTKEIVPFTEGSIIQVFDDLVEKYMSDDYEKPVKPAVKHEDEDSSDIKQKLLDATVSYIKELIRDNFTEQDMEGVDISTINEILESAEEILYNNDGIIIHNPVLLQDEDGKYKQVYSIFIDEDYDGDEEEGDYDCFAM